MNKHIGLFIDFENLIYGLVDRYGEQGAYELFKIQLLFEFASRYGEVACAFAYADWRMRAVNQWQVDLYGRGVELVHVLGRGGKNAVDIRMAVDLAEVTFTQPQLDTYILVSGDRDFLPAINLLKRRGHQVIALAPSRAMSREMKRVCDHAMTYEGLLNEQGELKQAHRKYDPRDLLSEMVNLMQSCGPDGLTGAQLKQMLLQSRGGEFSERDYGFISFGALLDHLAKLSHAVGTLSVVKPVRGDMRVKFVAAASPTSTPLSSVVSSVVSSVASSVDSSVDSSVASSVASSDRTSGTTPLSTPTPSTPAASQSVSDIVHDSRVTSSHAQERYTAPLTHLTEGLEQSRSDARQPASSSHVSESLTPSAHQRSHELQLALSCLKGYQYIQSAERRRFILAELYRVLSPPQGVVWAEALDDICDRAQLSRSQASKYHAILLQSQAFNPAHPKDERPVKHRQLKLIESLNSPEALIARYEQSVLHKVISRRGEVSVEAAADLLGVDPERDLEALLRLISIARDEVTK